VEVEKEIYEVKKEVHEVNPDTYEMSDEERKEEEFILPNTSKTFTN
jgi:hypothetical protein